MNIPLPFPYCPECGNDSRYCYHASDDCEGLLEIDPDTEVVLCTKCQHAWNLRDSRYHCSCGNTFLAKDIEAELDELIEDCKICAEELELMESARRLRMKTAEKSKEAFINGLMQELGRNVGIAGGYVFQKLLLFIKSLIG